MNRKRQKVIIIFNVYIYIWQLILCNFNTHDDFYTVQHLILKVFDILHRLLRLSDWWCLFWSQGCCRTWAHLNRQQLKKRFLIYKNFRIWFYPPPPSNIQTIFIGNSKKKIKNKKNWTVVQLEFNLGRAGGKKSPVDPPPVYGIFRKYDFFLELRFPLHCCRRLLALVLSDWMFAPMPPRPKLETCNK